MTLPFTSKELKAQFEEVLKSSPNQKLLIQREIDEILEYVNTIPNWKQLRKLKKPLFKHQSHAIFSIEIGTLNRSVFSHAFNENLSSTGKLKTRKADGESNEVFENRKLTIKLGNEFFKYYEWLTELLNKKQKIGRNGSLTLNQKVLALSYLGIDLEKHDKTKMSKTLAAILDMNEQNIRECLTYINTKNNEIRTRKNLESVQQLFENQDFFNVASKIQKDIESL